MAKNKSVVRKVRLMPKIGELFKSKSLGVQLLISHLLLVALMGIVMVGAAAEFLNLGRSIDRIFTANYRSVRAAQDMKDALERMDSASTFVLAGHAERAKKQYVENLARFQKAYVIESSNITEVGEARLVRALTKNAASYRIDIEKLLDANPPMSTVQARKYYFTVLEQGFMRLKGDIQAILDLNQAAILVADSKAKNEASRATARAVFVTLSALFLATYMTFKAVHTAVSPLILLTRQAEQIGTGDLDQKINIERSDEVGALAVSFNQMAEKLKAARNSIEHQLHLAQRMSDDALQSLYDPVIVTDANGVVVHVNRAAEGLFGSAQELVNHPVEVAISNRQVVQPIINALSHDYKPPSDTEQNGVNLKLETEHRIYFPRATPMHDDDGHLLGAVVVLEDVTHLNELDRLKTEFLGVASHELRTPVTSLLLSAELLKEGSAGTLNPKQQNIVEAQLEDLNRLNILLRDLLDLTRLEAGTTPPRFEIIYPGELVTSAVEQVSAEAETKSVNISINTPNNLPSIRADKNQIERVLVNLIGNSLRHTSDGGHIDINLTVQDGWVVFVVEDTGTGIPKEYLPRIFERFMQVPGATQGGAGLGLSISRSIVKAHGGEITVKSDLGKGSTFTFTIPKA